MGNLFSPPKIEIPEPAAQIAPVPEAIPEAMKSVGQSDLAGLRAALARRRNARSQLIIDPATSVGSGFGVGV